MSKKVSAHTLMGQASSTVCEYLDGAVKIIDAKFGKGYAKEHQELTSAFIRAAAMDFATAILAQRLDGLCATLAERHRDDD